MQEERQRFLSQPLNSGFVGHHRFGADHQAAYIGSLVNDARDSRLFSTAGDGGIPLQLDGPTVFTFRPTPDGERLVYRSVVDSTNNLFSIPIAGGERIDHTPALRPSEVLFDEGNAEQELLVSPDSEWVVFRTRDAARSEFLLYSARLSGGEPIKLSMPLPREVVRAFAISPDGSRVVYGASVGTFDNVHLFSVPIEGGDPIDITADLPEGFTAVSLFFNDHFEFTPDGSQIVFPAYGPGGAKALFITDAVPEPTSLALALFSIAAICWGYKLRRHLPQ